MHFLERPMPAGIVINRDLRPQQKDVTPRFATNCFGCVAQCVVIREIAIVKDTEGKKNERGRDQSQNESLGTKGRDRISGAVDFHRGRRILPDLQSFELFAPKFNRVGGRFKGVEQIERVDSFRIDNLPINEVTQRLVL